MNKEIFFEIDTKELHNEDFKYGFAIKKIWMSTNEDNENFANVKYYAKNKNYNLVSYDEGSSYVTFTIPMDVTAFNKIKTYVLNSNIISVIKLLLDICNDNDYKLYLIEDIPTMFYENTTLFNELSKHFPKDKRYQKLIKIIANHKKSYIEEFKLNQDQELFTK